MSALRQWVKRARADRSRGKTGLTSEAFAKRAAAQGEQLTPPAPQQS
jgi:hypothetical protein